MTYEGHSISNAVLTIIFLFEHVITPHIRSRYERYAVHTPWLRLLIAIYQEYELSIYGASAMLLSYVRRVTYAQRTATKKAFCENKPSPVIAYNLKLKKKAK